MTAPKMLFPTDFSPAAQAALEVATALAHDRGAELLIAHVEEPPLAYAGVASLIEGDNFQQDVAVANRQRLIVMLGDVLPTHPAVAYQHRLLAGRPAAAIVDLAAQENVELIVMSTHGRSGLSRALLGSVAEEVIRQANCPVLTVKAASKAV